eukprot:Ihof_evm4s183 gene=Ihof_evmTU4s183
MTSTMEPEPVLDNAKPPEHSINIVMLGDGGVGKSCLILQYIYKTFVEQYEPTKADTFELATSIDQQDVNIEIQDTAGQEQSSSVGDHNIKKGDGFI